MKKRLYDKCPVVAYYRRNLPHWIPEGKALFITWLLFGSLPRSPESPEEKHLPISANAEFLRRDAILDRADLGPLWLKDPRVAGCVIEKLWKGYEELHHYELHAYTAMPNHVHVLLTPKVELRKLMKSLKGATARAANNILNRVGRPFWQDESFDHWVRNKTEFAEIRNYIEHNPVTAGLVERPEDWPWSSASRRS
jgi:putative transposase